MFCRDVIVVFGSLFNPVNAVPHFDSVYVQLEYPLFSQEVLHEESEIGFQTFPDPGPPLPEKQGTRTLVGDCGDASHGLMLTLSPLYGNFHLDPVEAFMVEKSAILHLPDRVEKIVRHLIERNPPIVDIAVIPLRKHRLDTPKDHERGNRRIEKTNVENFQDRNKCDENNQQDSSPKPGWTFPRFPRHEPVLIRSES